jgi:hypothetical protein
MLWNTTLVVGMSLLFVSGSGRSSFAADPEVEKDLPAALAEFKEQSASARERNRIKSGAVVFNDHFAKKLSGRTSHQGLLYNPGEDPRLEWKEIVKLLGRPDSVYKCPIESQHASFDLPDDIDKALGKKELPFLETAFWYRLGQEGATQHALLLIFENGVLRKVKLAAGMK